MARALHFERAPMRLFTAPSAPRALRARGFTLIELMIVVVIVGILAALAVVGYRRLVTSSHVSEATNMVQSIRVAQEAYMGETQQYANISATLSSWYPLASPIGNQATAWGGKCTNCASNMDWSMLPLHVDGPVLFGYATVAGGPTVTPSPASLTVNGQSIGLPASPPTAWYLVAAHCDLDSAGGATTTVFTTSWGNQVYVDQAGQ